MKISDKFKQGKTVFSFEVFPPKKTSPIDTILNALEQMKNLSPDYFSVTYGAGGSNPGKTLEIASKIKNEYHIEALAHLTCINSTKEDVSRVLKSFKEENIDNILALRGDIVPDSIPKTDFKHANELCDYIKSEGDFHLAGACYPEVHCDAENQIEDIHNLKKKVDAGAEFLISQLFFDNGAFYRFLEHTKIAGIDVPVEAGIMPVTNKKQIERMVSMCGVSLPAKFSKIMQKYENNPEALRDAGIAYAIEQIVDLIANDVDGIHLYTMNNPYVATKIKEAVDSLL
ncbi:MAG: methylenetetrahydrofolate reductase [NAD(P)H] [Oscillospiraceae bacterium]|nr:methylenetetrahydrofolate reductase [NAD(P)H] [Oscillospiraceae bacterium]